MYLCVRVWSHSEAYLVTNYCTVGLVHPSARFWDTKNSHEYKLRILSLQNKFVLRILRKLRNLLLVNMPASDPEYLDRNETSWNWYDRLAEVDKIDWLAVCRHLGHEKHSSSIIILLIIVAHFIVAASMSSVLYLTATHHLCENFISMCTSVFSLPFETEIQRMFLISVFENFLCLRRLCLRNARQPQHKKKFSQCAFLNKPLRNVVFVVVGSL